VTGTGTSAGPAVINSENTTPYFRVFINVDQQTIGLVDYVNLAKQVISKKIAAGELNIPQGYFIAWSGQYESEIEARKNSMWLCRWRLLLCYSSSILISVLSRR
jgi:Cu(I)/Ag(I) efflux system membrane protein CusA/SilA